MKIKHYSKNFTIMLPLIFLLVISLLNMYGASFISELYSKNLLKQALWILIGFFTMFLIYKINFKILTRYSFYLYLLGIISLVLVLFFGKRINGATSWFKIGPISFQPSELFKFFYIIYLSSIVSKSKKGDSLLFLKIIMITFVPCILIFLEPDTGVVLMYLLMMFGILLESGIKRRYILALILVGIILLSCFLGLYIFKSDLFISLFGTSFFYRMDRLMSFKNSSSYQLTNALIGIGSSGINGLGLTSPKIYIPEVTTDFVFDLTICNFGFIAGIVVILLYVYILYRLYKIKTKTKKRLEKCIISAIFYMMFFQVAEHIMMNLGLMPITGITLPFLSYGGSSLLSYFMLFGLVLQISKKNKC